MNAVTVKRSELLERIKANRQNHRTLFEQAQVVYRDQMIAELDRMLADAKAGRKIVRAFILPEPEDHTDDYDRAIDMLEMSVAGEIEIGESDFNCYVRDEWGWQRSFASNTLRYTTG